MYNMADVLKAGDVTHLDDTTLLLIQSVIDGDTKEMTPIYQKMQTCIKKCQSSNKAISF